MFKKEDKPRTKDEILTDLVEQLARCREREVTKDPDDKDDIISKGAYEFLTNRIKTDKHFCESIVETLKDPPGGVKAESLEKAKEFITKNASDFPLIKEAETKLESRAKPGK